jgi:hypothetical protein
MNFRLLLAIGISWLVVSACQHESSQDLYTFSEISGIPLQQETVCVYVFIAECIISEASHKKIQTLYESFSRQGVKFIGIFPTESTEDDARAELDEILRQYEITFPVLIDTSAQLSALLNVHIVPTGLLIHREDLIYHGALDDQFYRVGQKKRSPDINEYLRFAIEQTLAGKKPKIKKTKAIGCVLR